MSYNITTWNVKTLDGLAIPVNALCDGDYFKAPVLDTKTGAFSIYGMDGTYIKGAIKGDGYIHVTEIQCYGEGSGSTYRKVLLPALEQSVGTLIVSCVWEGGDDLSRLTVRDGVVTEEEIDI